MSRPSLTLDDVVRFTSKVRRGEGCWTWLGSRFWKHVP